MVHPRFKKLFPFRKYKESVIGLPPSHPFPVLTRSTTGITPMEEDSIEPQVDLHSVLLLHHAQILVKYVRVLDVPHPHASNDDTKYLYIRPKPSPHEVQPGKRFTLLVGSKLFLAEIVEVSTLPNLALYEPRRVLVSGDNRSPLSVGPYTRDEMRTRAEQPRAEETRPPVNGSVRPTVQPAEEALRVRYSNVASATPVLVTQPGQDHTMLDPRPVRAWPERLTVKDVARSVPGVKLELETTAPVTSALPGYRPKRRCSRDSDEGKSVKRNKQEHLVSPELVEGPQLDEESPMPDIVFASPQPLTMTAPTLVNHPSSKGGRTPLRFALPQPPLRAPSTPPGLRPPTFMTNKPLPSPPTESRLVTTSLEEILAANRANRADSPAPFPPPGLQRVREPRKTEVLDRSSPFPLRTTVIPGYDEGYLYNQRHEEEREGEADEDGDEEEDANEGDEEYEDKEEDANEGDEESEEEHDGEGGEEVEEDGGDTYHTPHDYPLPSTYPAEPRALAGGDGYVYGGTDPKTGYPITHAHAHAGDHTEVRPTALPTEPRATAGYAYATPYPPRYAAPMAADPTMTFHGHGTHTHAGCRLKAGRTDFPNAGGGGSGASAQAKAYATANASVRAEMLTALLARSEQVGIFGGESYMIELPKGCDPHRLWETALGGMLRPRDAR